MPRLVDAKPAGANAFSGGADGQNPAQDYLERVAKYVPAEVIAAYLAVVPIITATTDGGTLRTTLHAIIFAACLILTPLYLSFMAQAGQPKRIHMLIGATAFLVWGYSITGGFFADVHWYQAGIAVVVLIIFSLASGLIAPTQGTK
jgi:hypothetical protein